MTREQAARQLQQGVLDFPTKVPDIYSDLLRVESEIEALRQRRESLRKILIRSIPTEKDKDGKRHGELEGVQHTCYSQRTTKWKDATMTIIDDLVPKTKHAAAHLIIEKRTSLNERHIFTAAKQPTEAE